MFYKMMHWCKFWRCEQHCRVYHFNRAKLIHDDVIKWKHFPHYWPFVWVPGKFPTQRPVTRSFDVFFDLHLNKRLSKQSWGWWFEKLSRPLWRHRNGYRFQAFSIWLLDNLKSDGCCYNCPGICDLDRITFSSCVWCVDWGKCKWIHPFQCRISDFVIFIVLYLIKLLTCLCVFF